ncbi:hypothetical protein J4407_03490 [Candidatus Pacearchaeota archaeon]|nr:hypothetical protein [Candidatus Pacearchaeota archaeon]
MNFKSSFYKNLQYQDGFCGDTIKVEIKEKAPSGRKFVNSLESYLNTAGTPRAVLMKDSWDAILEWLGTSMEILKDGSVINAKVVYQKP